MIDVTRTQTSKDAEAAATLSEQRAVMVLSFSQLLIGLVAEGWITEVEGEAWLTGNSLPAAATTLIGSLPTEQQFPAKARMLRMSEALRTDPLVTALAALEGKTDAEIDTFFTTYATV